MDRTKAAKTATFNTASIMLPSTESRLPFEVLIFRRPEISPVVAQIDWMESQKRTFDRLVDHLIGSHQHCARYCQAEGFQGLFINGETEAGWLLEGQIGGARSS